MTHGEGKSLRCEDKTLIKKHEKRRWEREAHACMGSPALDLRGLPVWERPEVVRLHCEHLGVGAALTFVTENEPRGLTARVEHLLEGAFRAEALLARENEWHVTLTRLDQDAAKSNVGDVLRRCAPFAMLDDETRDLVSLQCRIRTARKGEELVHEHDDVPELGIVWDGVAAVSLSNGHARERILYEVFPYETFGEIELFDFAPAIGRVVVLSTSLRCVAMPRDFVRDLGTRHPKLLFALAARCASRARDLAAEVSAQATRPIIARIAAALLPYAVPERGLAQAMAPLPTMTQSQVAATAGTVKEVAARTIAELEQRGALRRERGHIAYLNRALLAEIARTS
jgi:CRP-like cAMP-binding protein/uncharacterized protein (DUF2249 family)